MTLVRVLPALIVGTGCIDLLSALALMVERLRLLEDPTYVPMCSLNATFSCGSVITSAQASAFGLPNPLLGIVGFSLVLTVGMGLLAGARYRPWFWLTLQLGVTFAIGFVYWLMFQSIYRIEALCPYCMIVWFVTAILFWYVTLCNLRLFRAQLPRWAKAGSDMLQAPSSACGG